MHTIAMAVTSIVVSYCDPIALSIFEFGIFWRHLRDSMYGWGTDTLGRRCFIENMVTGMEQDQTLKVEQKRSAAVARDLSSLSRRAAIRPLPSSSAN